MRTFEMILLFWISVIVIAGCATMDIINTDVKEKVTETIKPSGIHEDCMELLPGQELLYSFEASQPVKFNIHCHDESGISYPVLKNDVSFDQGTFKCERKQYYCLMWTNPHKEPINLIYDYKVIDKQK